MARIVIITFLFCSWSFLCLLAQAPSDLYLFQLHKSPDHQYHLYAPRFLSGFNPGGYTNQPWFTAAGELLVSVRKAGEKQNDIYLLSLQSKKIKRVTRTRASEYSPQVHPDGQHLTFLRQVEGDSLDQQVVKFAWKSGEIQKLTPDRRNVGYYTWISTHELGLYTIERESNRLVYQELESNKSRRIASSVGRSLHSDGKGSLVYVHKFSEDYWYIKKFNPTPATIDIIVETPGKSEDFILARDGTYFIGAGHKLFFFHPDHHASWQEMADLSVYDIHQISRLAISPEGKQLALVSMKEQ